MAKKKYRLLIMLFLSLLIVAVCPSCGSQSAENRSPAAKADKAAIIDQLYSVQQNSEFITRTMGILERHNFSVDVWEGEDITVKFYQELPRYGYKLIIFRAHMGVLCLVDDSEVIPLETTCLFTNEAYDVKKYVTDQLSGSVYEGQMSEEHPSVFTVTPKFITDKMRAEFDGTTIAMMGCSSHYIDDMAKAFIQKGASVYMGWSATVTLDYVDDATLRLIEKLCTDELPIYQATSETIIELGPDPYYHARLKYFPVQKGNHTVRELAGQIPGTPTLPYGSKSMRTIPQRV